MANNRTWTFGEQYTMMTNFKSEGTAIANQIDKTVGQVTYYADKHGFKYVVPVKDAVQPKKTITRSRWTQRDDEILEEMYPTTPTTELRKKLSGNKSIGAIQQRANKMGIYKEGRGPIRQWSFEEFVIMTAYYPTEGLAIAKRLNERTVGAIAQYAQKMGIKSNATHGKHVTPAEIQIFTEFRDKGAKYCAMLTSRSLGTVYNWFKKIDAQEKPINNHKPWSDKDVIYLMKNYRNMSIDKLAKKLGRSKSAIYSIAHLLNIKKSKNTKKVV